jgi:hypothetical protein
LKEHDHHDNVNEHVDVWIRERDMDRESGNLKLNRLKG